MMWNMSSATSVFTSRKKSPPVALTVFRFSNLSVTMMTYQRLEKRRTFVASPLGDKHP